MVVTDTLNGKIRGALIDGVETYLGVPYGQAVGELGAFSAVSPAAPWADTLDCTGLPALFHQPPSRLASIMGPASDAHPRSDQAFTVNIFAPEGGRDLPVLVFLHGGGFASGGGARWYNGSSLARSGKVVVVTINYRLGIWGNVAAEGAPTNNAVHDALAGLRWISANIGAFGGDAGNLTLAGQSAGAYMILLLSRYADATGLFRRAILMSCPGHINATLAEAQMATEQVMTLLGAADVRAFSRETPARILEATGAVIRQRHVSGSVTPLFRPYIDGDVQRESTDHPLHWTSEAHCRDILIGFTREENTAFYWEQAERINGDPDSVLAWYGETHGSAASDAYRQVACRRARATPYTQWVDGGSDQYFARPTLAIADTYARAGQTFAYRFDLQTRQPHLHAPHCLELPFFFNNLDNWFDAPMLAGFSREELQPLASRFSTGVVNYVRAGHPGIADWDGYSQARPFLMAFDLL